MKEVYWCPGCGIVWVDEAQEPPPICRHHLDPLDPGTLHHPPRRMEPLPPWHPYASTVEGLAP